MARTRFMGDQRFESFQDIDKIINSFVVQVTIILKKNLCGIYLTGSLSYGDFNENSSDIDLTVLVSKPVSPEELFQIKKFHVQLEKDFEKWAKRLECTYTPIEMLDSILPPAEPRPWYCGVESFLYENAPYGNEWIINNYLLYHHAIPLFGPDFKELVVPINFEEMQKACIRDLFLEWEPKISAHAYLRDSHNQSYLILNLCRILYTVLHGSTGTKKISATWVKQEFGFPWKKLIELAENWEYGIEMGEQLRTLEFINFSIKEISKTDLFAEMKEEIDSIRKRAN